MIANPEMPFMRMALVEAEDSLAQDQLPVGCVIVQNGEVLGTGRKMAHAHPRLDHAETLAIRSAFGPNDWSAEGISLYTTLEPCIMCWGAILNCRIERIVIALEDPYGGASHLDATSIPRHLKHPPTVIRGVGREQSLRLFRRFFETTANPYWSQHRDNPLVQVCLQSA